MQVRLLGPVDVMVDGRPQVVGGLRRTGILAALDILGNLGPAALGVASRLC
jgi:hypothetical protein